MQQEEIKNIITQGNVCELKPEQNPDMHKHNKFFWYIVSACFILLIVTLFFINGMSVVSRI